MKKSQLRNIIREAIKEQLKELPKDMTQKPKQPMVPDCHMALQMEICEPGNTGWPCGFVFNWQGPIGGGACVQCNGQMCDSGDINQFFDNTSNGPIMTGGSPLKFKLLGFSTPTNSNISGVYSILNSQTPCAPCPGSSCPLSGGSCNDPNNYWSMVNTNGCAQKCSMPGMASNHPCYDYCCCV